MMDDSGKGLVSLLLLKLACCGGLVLATTGAFTGLGTWLLEIGRAHV